MELSLRVIQGLWGAGMALDWVVGRCRGTEGRRGCQDLRGTGQGEWGCSGWDRCSTRVLFWGDGVKGLPHRISLMRGSGTLVHLFFSCLKVVMSNSSLSEFCSQRPSGVQQVILLELP